MSVIVNPQKPCRIDAAPGKCPPLLGRDVLFYRPVEVGPHAVGAMPVSASRPLGVFGRALLEEVRVLDAIEDLREPRDRMLLHSEDPLQLPPTHAPVGYVADVLMDLGGGHP